MHDQEESQEQTGDPLQEPAISPAYSYLLIHRGTPFFKSLLFLSQIVSIYIFYIQKVNKKNKKTRDEKYRGFKILKPLRKYPVGQETNREHKVPVGSPDPTGTSLFLSLERRRINRRDRTVFCPYKKGSYVEGKRGIPNFVPLFSSDIRHSTSVI
jgi:hypothetical protein